MTGKLRRAISNSRGRLNGSVSLEIDTVLAVDAGNGFLKARYSGQTICVPSYILELDTWQEASYGPDTVVLEVDGKRYIIGRGAGQLNGQLLFEAGKARHYHLMVMAAMGLLGISSEVDGLSVRCLVPDKTGGEWTGLIDRIQSVKEFVANGQLYKRPFATADLYSEGEPVWKLVNRLKVVPEEFRGDRVAIVDLGSGDATAYLFTLTGDIDWSRAVMLPGLKEVASKVSAAIRQKPGMKGLADPGTILGLIRQGKHAYRVGGNEVDFSKEFEAISSRWITGLGTHLVENVWSDVANEIGMVYVTGGAAGLAQPLVEKSGGRFEILSIDGMPPQELTVYAMSSI